MLGARYRERRASADESPPLRWRRRWRASGAATLAAALAAAAAYASLLFTGFRGFSQFGLMGAVGALFCWAGDLHADARAGRPGRAPLVAALAGWPDRTAAAAGGADLPPSAARC